MAETRLIFSLTPCQFYFCTAGSLLSQTFWLLYAPQPRPQSTFCALRSRSLSAVRLYSCLHGLPTLSAILYPPPGNCGQWTTFQLENSAREPDHSYSVESRNEVWVPAYWKKRRYKFCWPRLVLFVTCLVFLDNVVRQTWNTFFAGPFECPIFA